MARFVREIMNPEVFTLDPEARSEDALDALLDLGITAAPVVDAQRRPLGVTSLRDLVRSGPSPRISTPARAVPADVTVEAAARIMAEHGHHHLVVVGGDGRTVGMISSLDLLRALLGLPASFPETFPHRDEVLGVTWTNPVALEADALDRLPTEPGILVLSTGGVRRVEAELWAEATTGLRARLVEMLARPKREAAPLAALLERRDLRVRCAIVLEPGERARVAARLCQRIDGAPLPRDLAEA